MAEAELFNKNSVMRLIGSSFGYIDPVAGPMTDIFAGTNLYKI